MKKQEYWIGAHTKYRLKYHIVFVPKYRKRILRGELVQTLKTLFYQACEVNDWYLEKLAIESDHIRMLLQCKPDKSLSQVVQILKGGTSFIIRKTHPELEEFLWGDSLWADGYFAESVGVHQEEMIRKYIDEQGQ